MCTRHTDQVNNNNTIKCIHERIQSPNELDNIIVVKVNTSFMYMVLMNFCRGISSTVRRCIEKETGKEFAAKIIDLGAEVGDASSQQMLDATRQEIAILRQVMGHPYISKYGCNYVFGCNNIRFIILQSNCKMSSSRTHSFSWFLNYAEMENCSTT